MQIEELKGQLRAGKTMDALFHYTNGQGGLIFKAAEFVAGNTIIYIPDIDLNEIPLDRPLSGNEEIEEVLRICYTGDDFVSECNGNVELAKRLFQYCDWQHPSSALPEIEDEEGTDTEESQTVELILPGGTRLKASAHQRSEHPCINIDIVGEDGMPVRVCFVEHNPDKAPGHEFCIGVNCSIKEDTTYFECFHSENMGTAKRSHSCIERQKHS